MKKIFFIFFITICFHQKNTCAQAAPVNDTLQYLQSIINNKANYVGYPFSKLFDSLQIQIKFFWPDRSNVHEITKEPATHFSFFFPQNADDMYLTYPCLVIDWQIPLNASQSHILWSANNGGGWGANVMSFYGNAIIANIRVWE